MTFSPARVQARVGDTVEWVSSDILVHTATARSKEWDVRLDAGKTARLEIRKAEAVDYYCRLHPNMTGRIDVEP